LQCSFRICLLKNFKIFQLLSNTFTSQKSMISVAYKLNIHMYFVLFTCTYTFYSFTFNLLHCATPQKTTIFIFTITRT
jgi:hypothetical protein